MMAPSDRLVELLIVDLDGALTAEERTELDVLKAERPGEDFSWISGTDAFLQELYSGNGGAKGTPPLPDRLIQAAKEIDRMIASSTTPQPHPASPPEKRRRSRVPMAIAAMAATVALVWYATSSPPFEPQDAAAAPNNAWPDNSPAPKIKQPSEADLYGDRQSAPPADIRPGDSDGQKAVAQWFEKLGVLPPVPGVCRDKALPLHNQVVNGDDKYKVITTRSYETIQAIDDILVLMSRPDTYEGGFIQGGTLRGRPVPFRVPQGKRAPLKYVLLGAVDADIPAVAEGAPADEKAPKLPRGGYHVLAEMVQEPSMTGADAVRRKLLTNVRVPAHYSKTLTHAYSAEHLNTQLGVAAKYFAVSAKLNVALSTKKEKATVVLMLRQEMYKMAVEAPRAAEWFTKDISVEDFSKAEVNSESPPCYVANVGYGRVVILMAESEGDYKQVQAALDFAYRAGFNKVDVNAKLDYKTVLESTTFRLMVYGGFPETSVPKSGKEDAGGGGVNVKEFKGLDGLADLAKLVTPDFDPRFAMPISYEIRNLADNRAVAIASASVHELVNESSAPYRYQVRVDRMNIRDTFRSFLGFGIGSQDGEFHVDVSDTEAVGTVSRKLGKGDHSVNSNTPVRSAPRNVTLNLSLRERGDAKGSWRSEVIDLAVLADEKTPGRAKGFGPIGFDHGNEASITVIAIPPDLPKE